MLCHHCGKQIKGNASFCPYCGKKTANVEYIDTNNNRNKKQPHKKPYIIGFVFFVIIIICVIFTYRELLQRKNTEADYVGISIDGNYIPNQNNIVYLDNEKSFGYVNNMILIFFRTDTTSEEINDIISSIDGKIVGKIMGINQIQVEVDSATETELEEICSKLLNYSEVKYAVIDYVFSTDSHKTFIPNDPWKDNFQGLWGVDWKEDEPGGRNWWIEATHILSAWNYDEYFSTINVGIVDNGFDTAHEDLNIKVLNENANNMEDHGTHVSGIMGAIIDNNRGISGILNHVNLYGVDCYATSEQEKRNIAVSSLMNGIVSCLDVECKVINMSSGTKYTNSKDTKLVAEESARIAAKYLVAMLDCYEHDFIIVQSAGNGNKGGVGVDAEKYGGYFASMNEAVIQSVFAEFEDKNITLEHDISIGEIMDSFMIVGAVVKKQKEQKYQLTDFSNYGKTITIVAPGRDIFSTVVSGGINGSYGSLSGTSMSAPIVAGITAMVWSVDPEMTSSEVRKIIVETAQEVVQSRNESDTGVYYMINAKSAVEKVINQVNSVNEWNVTPNSLIYVFDENGEPAKDYHVSISFVDIANMPQGPNVPVPLKDTITYFVDNFEPFELSLSAGIYQIIISKEDFSDKYIYYALVSQDGEAEHHVYTNYVPAMITKEDTLTQMIRKNYYDLEGKLIYYESYAYYDNEYLCSNTLYSVNYMSDGSTYIESEYTLLYLYDESGNLKDTILDAFTIRDWYNESTGEVVLNVIYDENGNSTKVCIYPRNESIEQIKFGVDSSKTKEIYGNAPVIITDLDGRWAKAYLEHIFMDEEPTDMTKCRLIYVDNNLIPELWIDYGYGYAGAEVYTTNDGEIASIFMDHSTARWIEKENLLLISGGHMGTLHDEVYKIHDGKFISIAKGTCNVQSGGESNIVYDYYWDDSEVTENGYQQCLNNIFNDTNSIDIYQNIYTYNQCKLLLQAIIPKEISSEGSGDKYMIPSDAVAFENHHYKFFALGSEKTWEEVKIYCESLGGYLAIIDSSEENDFLYQLMVEIGYGSAYFGITDYENENSWVWVDGTVPRYTNWHLGEPNSQNSSEDYGMFYWKYTDGTWNDGDFGKGDNKGGTAFICEWDN